jgi:CBS domain-containing protein
MDQTSADGAGQPAAGLLDALRPELMRHPPFAQMQAADVDFFIRGSRQLYFAPGEVVQEPAHGAVREVFFIRQGAVSGARGVAELSGGAIEYEAGDLFPVAAAVGARAVTATYTSSADTFLLALPVAAMQDLASRSAPFADFLQGRISRFLELSRQAVQNVYASQALAEQSLETPLGEIAVRQPFTCRPETPLKEALEGMHRQRIGSVIVCDTQGRPEGILTRDDVLGKIALPAVPLNAPVSAVMSSPVHALSVRHTAEDAALLMAREGVRHVPVTRDGSVVGLVSERDLFALQRLSLRHVRTAIRLADTDAALVAAAGNLRRLARNLLSQGVQARQLTGLVSHLNDLLAVRALELEAARHGLALERACWVALGSEGRSEQTIATDQDNALVLAAEVPDEERQRWLQFGRSVNRLLDACGYPLCRGGIMAGEPDCCLPLDAWQARFRRWIDQGRPEDLLNASIFFDLRPLAGNAALAAALQQEVLAAAAATPRFLHLLALNALSHRPPLSWLGGIESREDGTIDLKLQGTALFVDAARVYALSRAVPATGTRERLEAVAPLLGVPLAEAAAWVAAFEFLQSLRLRVQMEQAGRGGAVNQVRVDSLHDVDRRILKESLRVAGRLQQRLRLDYER